MDLKRLFTEHPDSVGETYFEHMRVALSFAGPLSIAAVTAFIHAFLPFLFVTTASSTVKRLYLRMTSRVPRPVPAKVQAAKAQTPMPDRLLSFDPVI